jgi:hypothetical protein
MRRILILVATVSALGLAAAGTTSAAAYGRTAQWQTAFSGNCNNLTYCGVTLMDGTFIPARSGFWGWCEFGGTSTLAMSGTDADCQVTTYSHSSSSLASFPTFHQAIHGTAWDMEPSTFPVPPGLPLNDFFITDGSVTLSGPTVVQAIAAGFPLTGCTVSGQTVTCPIPAAEALHIYSPDTGIPAAPGHYSQAAISEIGGIELPPGIHTNIQVTRLP